MLINYFFLLPENYLLFSTFFIFCYFIFFSFSLTRRFPKASSLIDISVKVLLLNFFFISSTFFSFNYGIRDIFFKDDLSNGFELLNILLVFFFFFFFFIIIIEIVTKYIRIYYFYFIMSFKFKFIINFY